MSRFFFFSSRRRHTRSYGDWSSDVCSSDLHAVRGGALQSQSLVRSRAGAWTRRRRPERSEERREGKSVDLGGRRIIKKKNTVPWGRRRGWRRVYGPTLDRAPSHMV